MKSNNNIYSLIFLLFLAVFANGCIGSILYQPMSKIEETPASINLAYKEYSYQSKSGNKIYGWWIPHEAPRYTVLFCHGNGGNISHRLKTIQMLHDMKLSVFIFDYSGYGKSEGDPGEKDIYHDGHGAWKLLTETLMIKPESVIVWGRSLGGAVAVELAVGRRPAALIVESSFSTLKKVVDDHTSCFFIPFGSKGKYRSKDKIGELKIPVCIIHSRDDEVIPYYHGEMLYKSAAEPKKFITIGGSHNRGFYKSRRWYLLKINEFLDYIQKDK